MTETNVYRVRVYCEQCDRLINMHFTSIGTAMYSAHSVKCRLTGHKPRLELTDDFGLEEDEITWETVQAYLEKP